MLLVFRLGVLGVGDRVQVAVVVVIVIGRLIACKTGDGSVSFGSGRRTVPCPATVNVVLSNI